MTVTGIAFRAIYNSRNTSICPNASMRELTQKFFLIIHHSMQAYNGLNVITASFNENNKVCLTVNYSTIKVSEIVDSIKFFAFELLQWEEEEIKEWERSIMTYYSKTDNENLKKISVEASNGMLDFFETLLNTNEELKDKCKVWRDYYRINLIGNKMDVDNFLQKLKSLINSEQTNTHMIVLTKDK